MSEDVKQCEHVWIISDWTVNAHSQTAKELICQKCCCLVDHAGLGLLRQEHVLILQVQAAPANS